MTTDLAALAREATDALSRGDLDGFLARLDPEVEFTSMIAEVEGETYRGHDGARRWWSRVRESFEHGRWEYEHIDAVGERGVGLLRIVGRIGGVPVEQTMWHALRLRDGRAVWWAFFRDEAEARAAAGLGE